jgi:hypothetical protein
MAVDRHELVKHQLRDSHGRWIKMGFKVKWHDYSGDHTGTVVDIDTDSHTGMPKAIVREYDHHGHDMGHQKEIPGLQLTVIPAKAVLKYDEHGNLEGVDEHAPHVGHAPLMHLASEPNKGYITLDAKGHNPMTETAKDHGHTQSLKDAKVGDQLYPVHWSESNGTSPYNLTQHKVHPKLSTKDGAGVGTVIKNDPAKGYIVVKHPDGSTSAPSKNHFGVFRNASADTALMKAHKKAVDEGHHFHVGHKGEWIPELAKDHPDHDTHEEPKAPEPVQHVEEHPVAPNHEPDHHITAEQSKATGLITVQSSDHTDITTPVSDLKVGDQLYPRHAMDTFGQNPYASTGAMGMNKVRVEPLSHFGLGTVSKVDPAKGEVKVKTANGSTYTLKFDRNVFKRTPEHDKTLSDSFEGYKSTIPSSMRWMEGLAGAKEVAPENKSNEHDANILKYDGTTLDQLPKEAVKELPVGTKITQANTGGKYWQKDAPNQWNKYHQTGVKLSSFAIPDSNIESSIGSSSAKNEKISIPQPGPEHHADAHAPEEHAPAAEAPHVESHAEAEHTAEVADHPMSIEGWQKIAGKSGSNPGGVYKDPSGKEWMVKFPQTSDHARNEVLAANLTKLGGIEATDMQLIDAGNGKLGVAAPMVKIKSDLKHQVDTNPEFKHKVQDGFAVDAWLANWDTVGLDFDNIVSDENGNPLRVDPGGSLLYRAMGAPKGNAFGNSVGEWDTLRNGSNWQTAHVFGDMTDQQLIDSAKHVEAISPEEIAKQVDAMGFDEAKTKELKDKLIARREDIIARAAALKPAEEQHAPEPAHEEPVHAPAAQEPQHEEAPAPTEPAHAPAEEPKAEAPAGDHQPAPEQHEVQKEEAPASSSESSSHAGDPFASHQFIDKGKTTTDSNGDTLKVGDLINHKSGKHGTGKVLKVLPSTESVHVVYPDGTEAKHQGHTVTKVNEHVEPKAAEELPKLAPGEYHHDSATGKSYIGAKDGTPLAVGDRVTYTKQGQTKAGKIKAIYKGDNAVAITWDDGSTSGTKKKASAILKEEAPKSEEPKAEEHAPSAEAPNEEPKAEDHAPAEEAPSEPAHEEAPKAEEPAHEEPKAEEPAAPAEGTLLKDLTDEQVLNAPVGSKLNPTGPGNHTLTKQADGLWHSPTGATFEGHQLNVGKNHSSGDKYAFEPAKAGEHAPESTAPEEHAPAAEEPKAEGHILSEYDNNEIKALAKGTEIVGPQGQKFVKVGHDAWQAYLPDGSVAGDESHTFNDAVIGVLAHHEDGNGMAQEWTVHEPNGEHAPETPHEGSQEPAGGSEDWKVGTESNGASLKAEQAPVGTEMSSVGWGQTLIKVGPNQWQNVWPDGDVEPGYREDHEVQQILDMPTENWKVNSLNASEKTDDGHAENSVMPPHIVNPDNFGPGYHYNTASAGTFLNADDGEAIEVKNKADNSFVGTFVKDDQGGWDHYGKTGDYEGKVSANDLVDQYGNGDHSVVSYLATNGYQGPNTGQESAPGHAEMPHAPNEGGQPPASSLSPLVGMKVSNIEGFDPNALPHGTKLVNGQGQAMIKTSAGWKLHAPGTDEHNETITKGLGNSMLQGEGGEDWTVAGLGTGEDFLAQPQIGGADLKGYEGKRLFEMPPVNLASALPGTVFSKDDGSIKYTKLGDNVWQVSGQDWTHSETWSDQAVKDVLYNQTDGTINHQLTSAGEIPTEGDNAESLSNHTEDSFKNLPKGTQITYTGINGNKGTYTKMTDAGKWEFTGAGYSLPSSQTITNDEFQHILGTDKGKDYKVTPPKPEEPAVPEAPQVEDPYHKSGFKPDAEYYKTLPAGTTIRREISYLTGQHYYSVKQEDGSWTIMKKTPSTLKVYKENVTSDELPYAMYTSGYNSTVSISIPKGTDEHFTTGTGEIGYVGDTVIHDGQAYKVLKINKTGLKLQAEDGSAPITVKPAKLAMDEEYGKKKYTESQSTHTFVMDPISSSFDQHLQKQAEENKLKNFAGADASEYDAQGLAMPHDANPSFDNGIKAYDAGPVDTTNPLYGAEKPTEPTLELPDMQLPSKWDSAAWLDAVKQRYLENPNKAKDSLEQSNKWSTVQDVVTNGNKDALKKLLDSQYVDQNLYDDALTKIDAGNAQYEAEKAKYEDAVKAATEKYNADKAQYDSELEAWQKANPSAIDQPYVAAVLPSVSTENFTGQQADWTKAHIGTHTAATVMSAIKDDNVLGKHGLSFAVDSDQIEHLDVKTTKVLNTQGDQVFEFKFKVTGPHGDVIEQQLKDRGVSTETGAWLNKMVHDDATGLLKDTGTVMKSTHTGTRYSYKDAETGANVIFQKSSAGYDELNKSNYNNTVRIHMPLGSTPEDFQKTIANLGITNARPSSEGDIRVFAENQLISMFGRNAHGITTYDPNHNHSGEARKKQLADIAERYGLTPDDLTFKTEVNGRVRFEVSDAKAQALAEKYHVNFLQHHVSGGTEHDTWLNILAGDTPGLLSTYHRWSEGIDKEGASSGADIRNGAGDYVYLTPQGSFNIDEAAKYGPKVIVKPSGLFKRLDYWANVSDSWGLRGGGKGSSTTTVGDLFDKNTSHNNLGIYEVLPKDTVPIKDFSHVVMPKEGSYGVPEGFRQGLIDKLKAKGIYAINGIPVEDFIQPYSGGTVPTNLTEWS